MTDAWETELTAFAARLDLMEAALASGEWPADDPWAPAPGLATSPPTAAQATRGRELLARADRIRTSVRVAMAEVGNALGDARQHGQAARTYLRADVAPR